MNGFFLASYVSLWIVVLVLAVAVLALYNHFGAMYLSSRRGRAEQGPALGTRPAAFTVSALDGRELALPSGRPALLLLASTDCPECAKLKAPLRSAAVAHADELDVVVLCGGPPQRVAAWAQGLDAPVVVAADRNFRRAAALGVGITPFVLGLDGDGAVRTRGLLNGAEGVARAVRDLLEESALEPARPLPLAAGMSR